MHPEPPLPERTCIFTESTNFIIYQGGGYYKKKWNPKQDGTILSEVGLQGKSSTFRLADNFPLPFLKNVVITRLQNIQFAELA